MIKRMHIFLRKNCRLLLLVVIIAMGFLLRLHAAVHQSFWIDETSIFTVARRNDFITLLLMKHWDKCHPQLFYVLIHFWQKISTNILFLRLPSLIAFIPASFFLFQIGRRINGNLMGFLGLILFAINPFFVNLGFQQKMYAFEMAFMFGSLYYLMLLLDNPQKRGLGIRFMVFSVLGFFTDYSFVWYWLCVFLLLGLGPFFQKEEAERIRPIGVYFLLSSLIMATQTPIFVGGLKTALINEEYLGIPTIQTVVSTVAYFGGFVNVFPYYWLVKLIVVMITLTCGWMVCRQKNTLHKYIYIFCVEAFYLVLSVSYFISQSNPIFLDRNLLVASLFFLLLMPMLASGHSIRIVRISITVVISIWCAYMIDVSLQLKHGFNGQEDFQEVQRISEQAGTPVTLVLVSDGYFRLSSIHDYYFLGLFDGFPIKNYNEIWITKPELFDWTLPPSIIVNKTVIFLVDEGINEAESKQFIHVYDALCSPGINCYGPFPLQ